MRRSTIAIALLGLTACRDDVELVSGLLEPVRVEAGFFLDGELPVAEDGPRMTAIESANAIALLGQDARGLRGRVSDDAWAVGVRFASLGSGWWIAEVGDLAPLFPGDRDFSLAYEIGTGVPVGLHALQLAALDEHGRRGPSFELDLCVLDDALPSELTPCDPTLPPPAMVIGATWNRDVDLDLSIETPAGKRVRWKSPTTATPVDGEVPEATLDDPTVGRLNRDSNAGCLADGRNAEAVVWAEEPVAGIWSAYVDLFDACGETNVAFTVSVYRRHQRDDGTWRLVEVAHRTGNLIAEFDAFGGANPPLYVLSTEVR